MENGEFRQSESKEKIVAIYSDFMRRIGQYDELVSTGSRLVVSFQQALGFLGRAPIDKTSTLVERIINAHGSRRVLSYFEAGCANSHDRVQNVSKLHTCHVGLQDYTSKAKEVVDELEFLLGNAASVVQTSKAKGGDDISFNSDSCITSSLQTAKEKDEDISCNLDSCITSIDQERPDVADYASMMAIIYSMVKQDHTMQVRIVSSLNHKSSQGELETYCQMWSLRPFVDDDIMHKAWNLVPGR
ncbi:uncharacterized protein LOC131013101 isoform X2 [Salvia miltiorrhiza]|nr:uncharacterized protein LOC131013101 isoform X2 [Salvia miltiorrhiza]